MRRLVPLGIALLMGALSAGAVAACSKDNAAIEKGGECSFANDCAPGLVCVLQKDKGIRICTDDLSDVAGDPPDMGEADANDEGGEAGEGGNGEGGMVDAPPPQDTGTDTGSSADTGSDTGAADTGTD